GGLVIVPTETFYGIAADPFNTDTIEKLRKVKGRESGKPVSLIADTSETALSACRTVHPQFHSITGKFWPGALTLILKANPQIPGAVTAGTGTVGIRIPGPSFALELVGAHRGLLTATSANRGGDPPPISVDLLDPELVREVDLVVDGGPAPGGEPSTLLDLTVDPPRILRQGALYDEVREFLGSRI
ncbi:MAG: L-threonylcarbamoyladenylate synthase, partial [bacterium]